MGVVMGMIGGVWLVGGGGGGGGQLLLNRHFLFTHFLKVVFLCFERIQIEKWLNPIDPHPVLEIQKKVNLTAQIENWFAF